MLCTTEPLIARCASHNTYGPNAPIAPVLLKPLIVGIILMFFQVNFIKSFLYWLMISFVVFLGLILVYLMLAKHNGIWILLCLMGLQILFESYLLTRFLKRLQEHIVKFREFKLTPTAISITLISNMFAYILWYRILN